MTTKGVCGCRRNGRGKVRGETFGGKRPGGYTQRECFTPQLSACVVTGCADLEPPANARVDRHDDSVIVRCNLSHETWYLTCKGSASHLYLTCKDSISHLVPYL